MKRLMLIGVASLALLACGGRDGTPSDPNEGEWDIIKSPLSGKCYEVYSWTSGLTDQRVGFSGMAVIDCPVR